MGRRSRRQGRSIKGAPLGHRGQQYPEPRQSVPAQGVDAPGGEHQPALQGNVCFSAGKHRAPCLLQPGAQLLLRQGAASGRLRHGAGHGHAAPVRESRREGSLLACCDPAGKIHGHGAVFCAALIGFTYLGKPILGPPGALRPHAEHLRAPPTRPVPVRKAAAGKGPLQLGLLSGGGGALLIQQPPIDARHRRHILWPLHAALQLHAGNTHLLHLSEIGRKVVVLQTQ